MIEARAVAYVTKRGSVRFTKGPATVREGEVPVELVLRIPPEWFDHRLPRATLTLPAPADGKEPVDIDFAPSSAFYAMTSDMVDLVDQMIAESEMEPEDGDPLPAKATVGRVYQYECPTCHHRYPVEGIDSRVCPECGTVPGPEDRIP